MKNRKMGKGILVVGLVLYGAMDVVAQSVTYSHDAAKMNQITVGEIGSGSLTPGLYYQALHKSYSKSAASKNKLSYRTLAGVNLYNQVDEAEALDSAMVARAKIEALNVADRSGGALDVAWAAEGGKITDKMGDFGRNINRILQTGGNGDDQSYWKGHYQMRHKSHAGRLYAQCPAQETIPAHLYGCGKEERRTYPLPRPAIQRTQDLGTACCHQSNRKPESASSGCRHGAVAFCRMDYRGWQGMKKEREKEFINSINNDKHESSKPSVQSSAIRGDLYRSTGRRESVVQG